MNCIAYLLFVACVLAIFGLVALAYLLRHRDFTIDGYTLQNEQIFGEGPAVLPNWETETKLKSDTVFNKFGVTYIKGDTIYFQDSDVSYSDFVSEKRPAYNSESKNSNSSYEFKSGIKNSSTLDSKPKNEVKTITHTQFMNHTIAEVSRSGQNLNILLKSKSTKDCYLHVILGKSTSVKINPWNKIKYATVIDDFTMKVDKTNQLSISGSNFTNKNSNPKLMKNIGKIAILTANKNSDKLVLVEKKYKNQVVMLKDDGKIGSNFSEAGKVCTKNCRFVSWTDNDRFVLKNGDTHEICGFEVFPNSTNNLKCENLYDNTRSKLWMHTSLVTENLLFLATDSAIYSKPFTGSCSIRENLILVEYLLFCFNFPQYQRRTQRHN